LKDAEIAEQIEKTWIVLADSPNNNENETFHRYRKFYREDITGIRIAKYFPGGFPELLVEIGKSETKPEIDFPEWKGMVLELAMLDTPSKCTWHVSMRLESEEHKPVFMDVCVDLIQDLNGIVDSKERRNAIADFLFRWSKFFETFNGGKLSRKRQQGLFGELWWLRKLIHNRFSPDVAISSWRGYARTFYDFNFDGKAVEVKTTLSKEPRKIHISNERQLQNTGLKSLHLLVLTLLNENGEGETVADVIRSIREMLNANRDFERRFVLKLRDSGIIKSRESAFDEQFTVLIEELFFVDENFPRLKDIPSGLADVNYSLLIASCEDYKVEIDKYIENLKD
jgi:hypothetical protein